jgi:hypothetical protein
MPWTAASHGKDRAVFASTAVRMSMSGLHIVRKILSQHEIASYLKFRTYTTSLSAV